MRKSRRIFYICAGAGVFVCGAVLEERYALMISLTTAGDRLVAWISATSPISWAGLAFAGGLLLALAGVKLVERRRFPGFRPGRTLDQYRSTSSEGKISSADRI